MLESNIYTIFYVIQGEWTPFSVKIASTKTVGFLKQEIKAKDKDLAGISARLITLYRIDVTLLGEKEHSQEHIQEVQRKAKDLNSLIYLDTSKKLNKIYPTAPLDDTIHILVQLPRGVR
jgi:hypothetical protein